eukprot:1032398-Prorocentrum_lima.AAC.1
MYSAIHRILVATGIPAAVACSCSLKEALTNPKAKAALENEWDGLWSINTWDESAVREWAHELKED